MSKETISARLEFLRAAESLKNVLRSGYTSTGRQESTAEHSWRLCLMALVLEDKLTNLDMLKVLKLCIVHDLAEAINGDIPAVSQIDPQQKSAQEKRDLQSLTSSLDLTLQNHILSLWEEYENATTSEAQAVKAMDKLETILQHTQGKNPADFDYAFNLRYGQQYTSMNSLFSDIRELVDTDTLLRLQNSGSGEAPAA